MALLLPCLASAAADVILLQFLTKDQTLLQAMHPTGKQCLGSRTRTERVLTIWLPVTQAEQRPQPPFCLLG